MQNDNNFWFGEINQQLKEISTSVNNLTATVGELCTLRDQIVGGFKATAICGGIIGVVYSGLGAYHLIHTL
jgi:hypothetical protein